MHSIQINKKIKSTTRNKMPIIAALACFCLTPLPSFAKQTVNDVSQTAIQEPSIQTINQQPKIQMAILLDTSGSMNGLIDQTRNQIWSVVNEFSSATKNGITPILEVALFEYGNDGNSKEVGHVRKLNNFTRELDRVSEGLFSLTTMGGSEYCGYAIKAAVTELQWSQSNNDIKTIFIAGNEAFTQGPVNYSDAIKLAEEKGIAVNTIFAGNFNAGVSAGWEIGAHLAGGDYMSIDANRQVVHINAPQDKEIARLNSQLNDTYIPYGRLGKESARRQLEQDKANSSISSGLMAKRAKSKSSSFYNNSSWDLVDALRDGKVKESDLAKLNEEQLPQKMRDMSADERKQHIQAQDKLRTDLTQEITRLSKSREQYVISSKKEQANKAPSVSDALSTAVKKQAKEKGFILENNG